MDITSLLRDIMRTDDRAVSPVLGVALLIAITVILAGVIGAVVLGVGADSGASPSATLEFTANSSGGVMMTHEGGDPIDTSNLDVVVEGSGTAADSHWSVDQLTAGNTVTVAEGTADGDVVQVVWNDPNSDKTAVLSTYTA